ncbi:ABC transporter substrate-binding protein [Amphritea balenae]|uniref:ABC transporter substrate-binding protein n=1 Tax=Amphritea balenae TaxID=452629 RepID=A0A3P1SR07_9GAMM|nr:ABC transporter substrate-binding protein [Amphritea balenae]RRC99588.1 ABC transporter substrate-binding protein [Amphritea balenae]GGK78268.1 hypothetical protein GCM10007941_30480 [Amphritea balenae]
MHDKGSGQCSGLSRSFRRQLSRRRILQLAGCTAILALPAGRLRAQPDNKTIRIGVMGPFTGPASQTGQAIRQGAIMALEDARAEGEVPVTVDNQLQDIDLVWIDSASDPDTAVNNMIRAVTRHDVSLLLGGWHSAVALAVMDAEVPYQILHLGHLGESKAITDKVRLSPGMYRGWFKGWPAPSKVSALYGEPLQHFQKKGLWQPKNNKAAVMVENSTFGRSWGDALRHSLKQAGLEPLPYDLTELTQTNFHSLLDRYEREQVSLVAMTTTGSAAAASFVRQFHQRKIKALLLAHGLRWFENWYELTADSSDFIITMDSAMPIALWQQWWVRRYQARFKQPPSIAAAGLHYDYTRMAIRVLNSASTLNLDELREAIYRTPYRGVWNRYRFVSEATIGEQETHEVVTGKFMEGFFFPMAQLFGGQGRIIWPPVYAEQNFRAPPWI